MSTHHEDDYEPTMHPVEPELAEVVSTDETPWFQPHAFHLNLPSHFLGDNDDDDGIESNVAKTKSQSMPGITRFAIRKARQIVELAHSIQINERMFEYSDNITLDSPIDTLDIDVPNEDDDNPGDDDDDDVAMDDADEPVIDPDSLDVAPTAEFETTTRTRLLDVHRKCARLQSQISGLENLKCGAISQTEMCSMFLHLLRLVTATVTYEPNEEDCTEGKESNNTSSWNGKAKLHYENVGRVLRFDSDVSEEERNLSDIELADSEQQLDEQLHQDFALPCPSREVLLLVLINMLSKKGPLRSVSNASIYPEGSDWSNRSLLLLKWKPLLRMLLRTAPYLDERKTGKCPVKNSNSRHGTVLKRTVQLCRDARHFFEQGIRPPGYRTVSEQPTPSSNSSVSDKLDQTSNEVWDMVSSDVLYHSHTHACYRGTIILYLFQPSRCSSNYYISVLPQWWTAWTNIDRCPEYDFLWLTMWCRARKYVAPELYDWSPVRQRLLTHCQYWLQLPIGGTSLDKSFPRAGSPRSRSCPPRLKVFAGASSSYEEGIDFVAKVAKLLVSSLGTGKVIQQGRSSITEGTKDVLSFLTFVTPYFNPSNLGSWTFALGALLHYFTYELCCRLGAAASEKILKSTRAEVVQASRAAKPGSFCDPVPLGEVVILLDSLLPLCKQALYSKNGHVGRAGEAAMLYLVQIDPEHSAPAFIDFAISALDIAAVNLSHQAPAALSALTRLVQPSLRSDPTILLSRLPEILRLSLAGIDSNDQNKTIRTLVLYRSLVSWIPVGGIPSEWGSISLDTAMEESSTNDGTTRLGCSLYESLQRSRQEKEYIDALSQLPQTSLLKQGVLFDQHDGAYDDTYSLLLEEASNAMSDWSLEFLDRVFALLRASGEREKTGKTSSAVANRHSSADVQHARNFSRVLKECLLQLFAAMDDKTHILAVRSVSRFLEEESLLSASKDASLLCQAAAAARTSDRCQEESPFRRGMLDVSPGLDSFVPLLTDDLRHHSVKTVCYRLRCLAGAVRYASLAVVKHKAAIASAIEFALSSDDRQLFKTGCKLLRHTLSTLSESYAIASDNRPRTFCTGNAGSERPVIVLGRSAQLHCDPVTWHVPSGESIDFAWSLLKSHVVNRLDKLCNNVDDEKPHSQLLSCADVTELRRCLRVIRYSLRGGASVMLDNIMDKSSDTWGDFVPYEKAIVNLMKAASDEAREGICCIRGRLCSFVVVLSSIIASETLHPDSIHELPESDPYRKAIPLISSDSKVCKETSDIALLLLTRRGASFRSQEARTIWKAQKQLASDFILSSQVDHGTEILQSAASSEDAGTLLYKDGEDGGKTLPRRLVVTRVQLFHDSLQRHASFEVPRRLRRLENRKASSKTRLFCVKTTLPGMIENLESILRSEPPHPLDAYEGIADGLYALCCHSNTEVRASSISVIDYALTRFGWMVAPRIPRLLAGLALRDKGMNGKFGVPCCFDLVQNKNQQGKRKRLAEAVKGICSVLSLSRSIKVILQSDRMRFAFAQTICGTDSLISLLPTEEMQKLVHYFQAVFSPFRSKIYYQPRISKADILGHKGTIRYTLNVLSEKKIEVDVTSESNEGGAAHWRKLLLACWFLMTFVDEDDLAVDENCSRVWSVCFRIIETETGQPLQRVALGLMGRLVSMAEHSVTGKVLLTEKLVSESFCKHFVEAIVFDHKEDTSVGGGHHAQWATGVEDIIRDAARNVAPRTLFPFQRTSQALGSFKGSHAQLIEAVLQILEKDAASTAAKRLLQLSKELAAAPPSEDQRNQQITSAEIIAGVVGSFLRRPKDSYSFGWEDTILPLLEDVVTKVPFSLTGAYFDTLRYALQFCPASSFFPLTRWFVEKIGSSLWQPSGESAAQSSNDAGVSSGNGAQGSEGFTAQSKWLYLCTSVIIEIDENESSMATPCWYVQQLVSKPDPLSIRLVEKDDQEESWQMIFENLLPRLIGAIGHPFDSCRDHISRCLFRICYCHRKTARVSASRDPSSRLGPVPLGELAENESEDPGLIIIKKLASLIKTEEFSFTEKYNALSTARRFISYCVHLGEAKFEYSDYVIPLLPLTFAALKSTVEDEIEANAVGTSDEIAAKRALEAEVIKGFRFTISEVSITATISYGNAIDISKVLDVVSLACNHETWQIRHAGIHFMRCFEGAHKFLFSNSQALQTMQIVSDLLGDDRREISSTAMAALTGILAALPPHDVSRKVEKYAAIAGQSKMKKQKKAPLAIPESNAVGIKNGASTDKETMRAQSQQTSVFFLCAAIMAQPYDTPSYVPTALAAISKHSFERNAPLGVRDTVKRCCAEYKRTHMSDNWDLHRNVFTQEQLEALDDVVSSPHYYA